MQLRNDEYRYVPFVEDLRSSGVILIHPKCFIKRKGVDAFLQILAEHDQRRRLGTYELRKRLAQLSSKRVRLKPQP